MALPYRFLRNHKNKVEITIKVYFDRDNSWVKQNKKNDLLLKHQQLHFDIAELYRRKVMKELSNSNLNGDNYKKKLRTIVEKYWGLEYPKTQNRYDDESNFSQDIKGQIKWTNYVDSALKKLKAFRHESLNLKLNKADD